MPEVFKSSVARVVREAEEKHTRDSLNARAAEQDRTTLFEVERARHSYLDFLEESVAVQMMDPAAFENQRFKTEVLKLHYEALAERFAAQLGEQHALDAKALEKSNHDLAARQARFAMWQLIFAVAVTAATVVQAAVAALSYSK